MGMLDDIGKVADEQLAKMKLNQRRKQQAKAQALLAQRGLQQQNRSPRFF